MGMWAEQTGWLLPRRLWLVRDSRYVYTFSSLQAVSQTLGCEDTLIDALSKRKDAVKDLTVVSNNVGSGDKGLGESFSGMYYGGASQHYERRQAAVHRPN